MTATAHHITKVFSGSQPTPDNSELTVYAVTGFFHECTYYYLLKEEELPDICREMNALSRYYGDFLNGGFSQVYFNMKDEFDRNIELSLACLNRLGENEHVDFLSKQIEKLEAIPANRLAAFRNSAYFGLEGDLKEVQDLLEQDTDWFFERERIAPLQERCAAYLNENALIDYVDQTEANARMRMHVEAIPNYSDRVRARIRPDLPPDIYQFLLDQDESVRLIPGPPRTDSELEQLNRRVGKLRQGNEFLSSFCTLTDSRVWEVRFLDYVDVIDAADGNLLATYPISEEVQLRFAGGGRFARRPPVRKAAFASLISSLWRR